MRGRFAPSPSGVLHLGNLAMALLSWLDMRLRSGEFLLRVDDLDATRCKEEFTESSINDLKRLGIDWDHIYYQSAQLNTYKMYLQQLCEHNLVYACECSRSQKDRFDTKGVYLGFCRDLGISLDCHALRLVTKGSVIEFEDRLMGNQIQFLQKEIGDFIVKRRDGIFAYHLACAIDEHTMGISNVFRGKDLVHSTARQLYIMDLLGFSRPQYAHAPLVLDKDGDKLSKRSRNSKDSVLDSQKPEEVVATIAREYKLLDARQISASELLAELSSSRFDAALSNK